MKTNLSKISLTCIIVFSLLSSVMQQAFCQEMLIGGSMEASDENSWTVTKVQRGTDAIPDDEFSYEFGNTANTCTSCSNGAFYLSSKGTVYSNIVFSQKVTLKANTKYITNAAFRDLTGTLTNFWAQLKIDYSAEIPAKETGDGIKLAGFNTWNGCGQYVNGTFRADGCDSDTITKDVHYNGAFTTPDTLGSEFTAVFAIMVGMWTNTASGAYPFEIIIDEVSLIDSVAAIDTSTPAEITTLENTSGNLTNFPNPATNNTTISYSLSERSSIKLAVYNLLGEEVECLFSGVQDAGKYELPFDLSNYNSSMLICKLEIGDNVITNKMFITK